MIRWTEQASGHLEDIYDYIARSNSDQIAAKLTELVLQSVERLEAAPMLGRAGRIAGTQELVVTKTPFVIAYAIKDGAIAILAIYHGAQQWPTAFP